MMTVPADDDSSQALVQILLIEDEPGVQRLVCDYLIRENMRVSVVASGRDVPRHLATGQIDLAILDLRLGTEDGLDLLRAIRAKHDVPVIITTGHRKDEIDRVVGLELGADDYLTRPFGLRELLARIRVVLRRAHRHERTRDAVGLLHFGRWQLNRRDRRLTVRDGTEVALTKGEYALLVAFLKAPGRTLSREHLLEATHIHQDVFDRSIDVQILRLCRKLEEKPSAPEIIRTDRGVGYTFTLPVREL